MLRVTFFVSLFCMASMCLFATCYTIPSSESVPLGLYKRALGGPRVGDYVELCPSLNSQIDLAFERGYLDEGRCETGLRPMIKMVIAKGGDSVVVSKEGVFVNSQLIPLSSVLTRDSNGRSMASSNISRELRHNEIFVLGTNSRSYDSRYFGPVLIDSVESKLDLVWGW